MEADNQDNRRILGNPQNTQGAQGGNTNINLATLNLDLAALIKLNEMSTLYAQHIASYLENPTRKYLSDVLKVQERLLEEQNTVTQLRDENMDLRRDVILKEETIKELRKSLESKYANVKLMQEKEQTTQKNMLNFEQEKYQTLLKYSLGASLICLAVGFVAGKHQSK